MEPPADSLSRFVANIDSIGAPAPKEGQWERLVRLCQFAIPISQQDPAMFQAVVLLLLPPKIPLSHGLGKQERLRIKLTFSVSSVFFVGDQGCWSALRPGSSPSSPPSNGLGSSEPPHTHTQKATP